MQKWCSTLEYSSASQILSPATLHADSSREQASSTRKGCLAAGSTTVSSVSNCQSRGRLRKVCPEFAAASEILHKVFISLAIYAQIGQSSTHCANFNMRTMSSDRECFDFSKLTRKDGLTILVCSLYCVVSHQLGLDLPNAGR